MDIDRYTLHRARVTAGLTLQDLATRTRISPGLLKLIDDGRFDRLPGGIYARSYVRAVATILGIDPDEAVRALGPLMRDAQWGASPQTGAPANTSSDAPATRRPDIASAPAPAFTAWQGRDDDWRRWGASAIDGVILIGVWVVLWAVARMVAGADGPTGVTGFAAVSIAAALLATIYFIVFAGLGGATLGDQVAKVPPMDDRVPLQGALIGRRATLSFLMKASILVDVVYTTEWALDAFGIKSVE